MFAPLGEKPLAQMRSPFQGLPDSPSGLWYLSLPLQRRAEVGIPAIRVGSSTFINICKHEETAEYTEQHLCSLCSLR